MKDIQGNELKVGDTVVFTDYNRTGLQLGTVAGFTNHFIKVTRGSRSINKTPDYVCKAATCQNT